MLDFFINNFFEYTAYATNLSIPFLSNFTVGIYFSCIIWIISIILQSAASTRVNLTSANYRTSLNSTFISLYKL